MLKWLQHWAVWLVASLCGVTGRGQQSGHLQRRGGEVRLPEDVVSTDWDADGGILDRGGSQHKGVTLWSCTSSQKSKKETLSLAAELQGRTSTTATPRSQRQPWEAASKCWTESIYSDLKAFYDSIALYGTFFKIIRWDSCFFKVLSVLLFLNRREGAGCLWDSPGTDLLLSCTVLWMMRMMTMVMNPNNL